jgi:hypothetical protein
MVIAVLAVTITDFRAKDRRIRTISQRLRLERFSWDTFLTGGRTPLCGLVY